MEEDKLERNANLTGLARYLTTDNVAILRALRAQIRALEARKELLPFLSPDGSWRD